MSASQQVNKSLLRIWLSSCVVFLLLLNSANAEIYVSTSVDGVQKWSTQAIDETYTKSSIAEYQPLRPTTSLITKTVDAKPIVNKSKIANATQIELLKIINKISNQYSVDPDLVEALVAVESGFNTNAISSKGARGLMQLMPATAKRYGMKNEQELHIPGKNIDMGVRHLKDLLNLHNGQVSLAIASYNAGLGAVTKHGQRIPQYRETMIYVPAVLAYMASRAGAGVNQDMQYAETRL
jgi:soluble lytic murein transglycosylase-like protein